MRVVNIFDATVFRKKEKTTREEEKVHYASFQAPMPNPSTDFVTRIVKEM